MTLPRRLDRLSARIRPVAAPVNPEDGYAKFCVVLERYAPPLIGAAYPSTCDRLDAVLDRLTAIGWTIPDRGQAPRMARLAAALGWPTVEFRAALQARARGERRCG